MPATEIEKGSEWESDSIESRIGIHVIPSFGDEPTIYSQSLSEQAVLEAIASLDWIGGFHQVVVVTSPGTSMEVGGSLNPEHGLSAVYRNRVKGIHAVTKDAPEAVADLEAILVAFLKPGDDWMRVQEFEFWGNQQ